MGSVGKELAAVRTPSHHHVPYGRMRKWARVGARERGGVAGEIAAARKAAELETRRMETAHLQAEASANKRAVAVEDAYSLPNGACSLFLADSLSVGVFVCACVQQDVLACNKTCCLCLCMRATRHAFPSSA